MSAEVAANSVEIELVGGGGGIFDVEVDGQLIFSRFESGRFPEPGEISGLLTQR